MQQLILLCGIMLSCLIILIIPAILILLGPRTAYLKLVPALVVVLLLLIKVWALDACLLIRTILKVQMEQAAQVLVMDARLLLNIFAVRQQKPVDMTDLITLAIAKQCHLLLK